LAPVTLNASTIRLSRAPFFKAKLFPDGDRDRRWTGAVRPPGLGDHRDVRLPGFRSPYTPREINPGQGPGPGRAGGELEEAACGKAPGRRNVPESLALDGPVKGQRAFGVRQGVGIIIEEGTVERSRSGDIHVAPQRAEVNEPSSCQLWDIRFSTDSRRPEIAPVGASGLAAA
jgi:hypothetical protein